MLSYTRAAAACWLALAVVWTVSASAEPAAPDPAPPAGEVASDWDSPDQTRQGGGVVVFGDIRVPPGEVRRGDLVCVFGDVTIEGEAKQDVVVIGGNLRISGSVRGSVVTVLSHVRLDPSASMASDLFVILGGLTGDAEVRGDLVHIPLPLLPHGWRAPFGMLGAVIAWGALLSTTLIFLLLLLFAAVAPARVRTISDEAAVHYLRAWVTGVVAYFVAFLIGGVLAATVLGIPLAIVFYFAFLVLKWFGLAGVSHRIGSSIGRSLGRELSLLGAILVGFLPYAVLLVSPIFLGGIGFALAITVRLLFWITIEIPSVGLVVLTRAGARPHGAAPSPEPPIVPAPVPLDKL